MKRIYKIQINDNAGTNLVDEVLNDNRITAHPDFGKIKFDNLAAGDLVMVHKGSFPTALTQVVSKIENQTEIQGVSFGRDYKIDILGYFNELPENSSVFKKLYGQIGFNGTFQELGNDTPTYKAIKNWYRYLKKNKEMEDLLALLKFKKQIILQGPPGTGKTRLAKVIADKLLTRKINNSPLMTIKKFLTDFKVDDNIDKWRRLREERRSTFLSKFPAEGLNEMSLEDYCIGQEEKDNFCWWIERGLESFGRYTPGSAVNYYVYFNKAEQIHKTLKRYITPDDALNEVRNHIFDVVNERYDTPSFKKIGQGYTLRLLAIYHPEKYVHVFKHENQKRIANFLEIDDKLNFIELNAAIRIRIHELIRETKSEAGIQEVIHFLFQTLLVGEESEIQQNEGTTIITTKPSIVQFHPSYAYEDFVRGIIVEENTSGTGVLYRTQNKILGKLAEDARSNSSSNYVLIIDEINRANLSSVLGELIYALEYRDEKVDSMYDIEGDKELILPSNLYIIGTMNTADRSVGHIDYAIRRRFAFVDLMPKNIQTDEQIVFHGSMFKNVSELFISNFDAYINDEKTPLMPSVHLSPEFIVKDVWLGHSYFIQKKSKDENNNEVLIPESMQIRLEYEIKPILREYVRDGILIGENIDRIINDLTF